MDELRHPATVVILGATGAVGEALAARLTARGSKLLLVGRDAERLQAMAERLASPFAVLDGLTPGAVAVTLRSAVGVGKVGGIAHCIGSLLLKPARATSDAEWQDVIDVNLSSAFGVAKVAPEIVAEGGSVVFCSSVAAGVGLPNHEAIAAVKAGIEGLTRAFAAGNLRRGIRCNCVAPALVASRMTQALLARPGMLDTVSARNPSGRIGRGEDIARAIEFLLDPANSWINGQVVGVDGGFGAVQAN